MDAPLHFVLELYRLAQQAPITEFPDLALSMLKAVVPFQSATWSEAELTSGVEVLSVHLHNEPDEVRGKFASYNAKHTRRVYLAAQQAGRASVINDMLSYYDGPGEGDIRAYMRKYGHDRNLLITDRHQWLSLYRPRGSAEYTASEGAQVNLLWSHLAEALAINRALAVAGEVDTRPSGTAGARALIDRSGTFLHCGMYFRELLRLEWPDWSEQCLSGRLLEQVLRGSPVRIAKGEVEIAVRNLGAAILLAAKRVSRCGRLSPRELAIAREFSDGKSYKAIARDLDLAPATVRNVLQKVYRKLDIDNKAALVKLFEIEYQGRRP